MVLKYVIKKNVFGFRGLFWQKVPESTRIHRNPSVAFRSLPWPLGGVVSLYHNQKTKVCNHKKQNYHGIKVCSK